MVVYKGSRYEGSKVTLIKMEDGAIRPYIHDRVVKDFSDIVAPTTAVAFKLSDELDLISWRIRKKDNLWWEIADVNALIFPFSDENLDGPNYLSIGRTLFVTVNPEI